MQPRITIKHPDGDIELVVTHPRGLVSDLAAERTTYGIVFISAARADEIYRDMDVSNVPKLAYIVEHLRGGEYELPLLVRHSAEHRFHVRNDAHVLAALVAAGVDPVPVVVHVAEAQEVESARSTTAEPG